MAITKYTISRDDSIYEAWPDVVLTEKGKLICVFSECTYHTDRSYTRIVLKMSTDRGRTWGPKVSLTEGTNGLPYWNCARISKLSDGRLVIVCDKIFTKGKNGIGEGDGKSYLWFGDAEGENWSEPVETPVIGIVPDKLLELTNGRWILSAHKKSAEHGYLEQSLWYSDNQGKNWKGPIIVGSQEGLNLCEVSILSLPDSTLVAFMRENSSDGKDCYKSISKDNGETWDGPYRMPLPGCHRPVAGILQSGNIMITYRFIQGGKGWLNTRAQNFFAALTDVEAAKATERKEQSTRIMPIDYDRSPSADLGYSGWVQFDNGEIYIVSYIVDDAPKAQIRGYSLSEKEFLI